MTSLFKTLVLKGRLEIYRLSSRASLISRINKGNESLFGKLVTSSNSGGLTFTTQHVNTLETLRCRNQIIDHENVDVINFVFSARFIIGQGIFLRSWLLNKMSHSEIPV